MASVKKRLPGNVAGEFYVDSTCIAWMGSVLV
jgi:hypothetical protein